MKITPAALAAMIAFMFLMMLASGFANAQAPGPSPAVSTAGAAGTPGFRCGGIGIDESEKMKAEAAGHDMILTFASTTGAYLADVEVAIVNARGETVLSGRCTGPIMLVDLPTAGDYRIAAQYNGQSRQQTVRLARPGKGTKVNFTWQAR